MPVRSQLRRRRAHKSYKNGFSSEKNELSALQEEKLHDFKESFVEQYQETPLYAAFLVYFFFFYQYLFKCFRFYLVKIGLRKPDEPKERGNKVSMHAVACIIVIMIISLISTAVPESQVN